MKAKRLGILILIASPFAAPWPCRADAPVATFSVLPSPEVAVADHRLDVVGIVTAALEASGCRASGVAAVGEAFVMRAEAAVTNDVPAICAIRMRVMDAAGAVTYAVPRTVEDAICSLPWLQGELERHTKIACELATAVVTKKALSVPPPPAAPAASLSVSADAKPPSRGKLYTGAALLGGGVLVGALGASLWAIDGESLGPNRQADTSGGALLTVAGVAAIAGGAYLLWEALK
ncbi:MAG: hypothetical protein KA712_10715 [Myxococcales bacterium]|nr:hypothetical protein [Myxococcales bacterium]